MSPGLTFLSLQWSRIPPLVSFLPPPSSAAVDSGNPALLTSHVSCGRRHLVSTTLLFPFVLHEPPSQTRAYALERTANDYYSIVRSEIRRVLSKAKSAGVLRLSFHDAGTFDVEDNLGGMNGSIVFELDRPENSGLKKSVKVLEKAKVEVEKLFPNMISLGGAEAVSFCGGPVIPVQAGRVDAGAPDPEGRLPGETLDAFSLKECFMKKGLSTQDLVALSGAHTLGGKGFGDPYSFDNSYFKILLQKPWKSSDRMSSMIGLPSDRALVEDDGCLRWITVYANDEEKFFEDFKEAYLKLVNIGAHWQSS